MAPISLKDPNIQAITEEFVKTVTGFKKSSRNFTLSVQFALSNFRYHQFLDVNSTKVMRNIDGVCQKLKVHSQSEKAGILRNLCDRFLELPLNESSKDVKTDTHYSLLLLLLTLADSPTNAEYVQPLQEETSEEESFDWESYLLDGEEEEILGIPSNQYQEWSDEEEDDLEVTSDSGVSLGEHQALLAKNRQGSFHDNTDTRIEFDTLKPSSIRGGSWIKDQIVDQYWEKSFDTYNNAQESESRNCSVAKTCLGEHQALLAKNRQGSFHDNTDTRIEFDTLKPSSIRGGSWIKDQIVDQYWEKSFDTHNNAQESESRNCSVAKTWESYQRECNPFYSRNYNITLTETQIVRETLWMLYGVKNTFVYKEMCQEVLTVIDNIQVLHLTPESLASLLSSFLEAGQQSNLLQRFVSSVLNPQSESTQTSQAFASALSCHFKDYKAFLSSIEKDIIKQEDSVTLLILQNKLKSSLDEINTLFFVYQAISEDTMKLNPAQRTCKLLNTLYSTIVQTDALGSAAKWKVCLLLKVFLQTVEPCLCFINEWVTSGWVCDPHNEFFIQRIHDISVDSVKFWSDGVILRCSDHPQNPVVPCFLLTVINQIFPAVKSVELTCGLGKMTEYLSKSIKGSLYQTFLDALLTSLSLNLASEENNACGNNEDNGCLLDAITSSDQVLSVIKETGDHVLKLAFMNVSPLSSSSLAYQSATAGKVTRICSGVSKLLKPVNLLITGCLTPLIEECCLQASSSAVKLMREHFCLLDHLAAMRNFFLLEAGDAMHQFYVQIFNKARRHETWQDISFLNSLMQEALQPRFPKAIERLVVNLSGNTSSSTNRKQGNKSLQGLALNYKAPWPVNIIIDSSCQKLYNLVFLFLLKLKQAKWSLDELRFSELQGGNSFHEKGDDVDEEENKSQAQSLSNLASARPASPVNEHVLHKMFLLRFKLLQFINSIHTHFMTRILHSTGLEFQKALDQAKNLDDLIKAHSTYVEKLYDRCLLSQKVGHLREVILKVLNLVLLFQSYWDNGAHNMSVDKFKKMDEEFTKCNTFLVSCLANIVKRGAFPHLESLAFALSSSPSVSSTS